MQAWDRYAYANNNPSRYTDPTGHWINETNNPEKEQRRNAYVNAAEKIKKKDQLSTHLKEYYIILGPNGGSGDDWWDVENGNPEDIFNDMADESDIAFNYPLDGCYARAHIMMMRILQRYGILPEKVWAFGSLEVSTNGAYGEVGWGYHVAPVIPVTQSNGSVTWIVIDPSIANGTVTVDEWLGIMHTNANESSVVITSFWQSPISSSEGHGYFPNGPDPSDVNQYSAVVMQNYMKCGALGIECPFVNP